MRPSLRVASVAAAVAVAVFLVWPRPSLEIRVERGGRAYVNEMFNHTPLPETVYVRAVGSNTVIRIANEDTVRHHLALFDANPGETRDFVIAYPGTYGGFCSTHPDSKQLVYVIE